MSTFLTCASHSPLLHCFAKPPADWDQLKTAFDARREAIKEFNPDLVVAFGSDHFNGFFMKMMPSFCVGTSAHATGDIGGYEGDLNVPEADAVSMVEHLRAEDIDPAISFRMTIDHAFSQTIHEMCGSLDAVPVIPVFINCITTPFVPFRRTRLLGESIGRWAKASGKRVLLLGSGGMSHHPTRYYPAKGEGDPDVEAWQLSGGDDPASMSPSQWLERLEVMHHEGAEMIVRGERTAAHMRLNEESDRKFLDVFTTGKLQEFDNWDQYKLVEEGGIGSMELHTWIAAAAAHQSAGGTNPELDFYTVAPELGIACGLVHAA